MRLSFSHLVLSLLIRTQPSTELEAGKRLALQEEKQALEVKLLEIPKLRARLAELKESRSPVISPSTSRSALNLSSLRNQY